MNISLRVGVSLIVIGLGTILSATSALGQVAFVSKPTLTTGNGAHAVAVGDFKNNQDVGVAVTSLGTPAIVTVFQGNGDGTFGESSSYPTGASPAGIAVGDFKNRGAVDLAIANQSSDSITILLNTGTGSGLFTAGTTITLPAGSAPTGIAVGDFDGDHNQDLAVTSYNDSEVFVLLGNGDGTFQAPLNFAVGASPTSIVVADFNRDGADDIAVTNSGSFTITVLLGDGSGMGFAATNYDSYSPHGFPHATGLAVGDFNRDGYPDLAVAFSSVSFATVLLNQGNGTFKAPVAYPTTGTPSAIATGDIDHNGKLALLVPCSGLPATLSVFQGIGDGTFSPAVAVSNSTASASSGIAIGPFTGSKHVDVAVADSPNLAAIFVDDIVFADGFQ